MPRYEDESSLGRQVSAEASPQIFSAASEITNEEPGFRYHGVPADDPEGKEVGGEKTVPEFVWSVPEGAEDKTIFTKTAGLHNALQGDYELTPEARAIYERGVGENAARLQGAPTIITRRDDLIPIGDLFPNGGMEFEQPEVLISEQLTAGKPSIVTNAGGVSPQVVGGEQGGPTTLPGAGKTVSIERPDPWRVKGQPSAPGTGSASSAEQQPRQRAPRRRSGQPRRPSQG